MILPRASIHSSNPALIGRALCSDGALYRDDILAVGVRVEMPLQAVVAVREPVLGHPVFLVASASRNDARHQRRRTHVELQPLVV